MKKSQVQVGKVYAVKVSGSVEPVRIDLDCGTAWKVAPGAPEHRGRECHQGWDGTNLSTGRRVRIRSAAKVRYEMARVNQTWEPVPFVSRPISLPPLNPADDDALPEPRLPEPTY